MADELRKLAERTMFATRQISETIMTIQRETDSVMLVMQAVAPRVEEGVRDADAAAQALQQISLGSAMRC